jgi:two-component system sensor histidine kinase BaeS
LADQLAAARAPERDFLLSVSHELKTPLTAIRGYAEGLAEGAFEPEETARVIRVEGERLERLVRDLLDLARMNRAEFSVRSEPVDLGEVAREIVHRHGAKARELGVELTAAAEESWVDGDGDRILQIASNLVENALRETPTGGAVTVSSTGAELVVADTGPGIAPEDLPHAVDRIYQ